MMQLVSLLGAACILAGYAGLQKGWLGREDRAFNVLNFVGSMLLLWVAIVDRRTGFIVLETVWSALSVPGMLRRKDTSCATPS
jgi:drug/metabolite transporter (DMT)-like permease